MLLKVAVRALCLAAILTAKSPAAFAQTTGWQQLERCAGLPSAAPLEPFDGLLVTVDTDATRVYRAAVATTYVLSFAGGNFLDAGAISPDGRYYAVPNGVITTVSNSDVRYVVQEIRIVTTETVPRIVKRLPWRASFPVGTRFTSSGDIPRIRWLDNAVIQFVDGTISEGQHAVQVDVFSDTAPIEALEIPAISVSPDNTLALAIVDGGISLISLSNGEALIALPDVLFPSAQVAWSPDSARFVIAQLRDGNVALGLFTRDGAALDTVVTLAPEQVLWNLRWSPDGSRIAFSAFDPQSLENRMVVVDVEARTVTDTCLPIVADVDGASLSALAWSPDGTRLAYITTQGASRGQIQVYSVNDSSRYNLIPAAGRLLGWYP